VIDIIYSVDYKSERFGRGDNDHCVICQEKWDDVPEEEDTVDRINICGHIYHHECLEAWFNDYKVEMNHSCPLCRSPLWTDLVEESLK
jgi:hypothetical protein